MAVFESSLTLHLFIPKSYEQVKFVCERIGDRAVTRAMIARTRITRGRIRVGGTFARSRAVYDNI